ncbi:hypothetical protein B0J11DRAFT_341338 [Dendryphion nanum]|uniref:Uncharacterized protein n=1 Tax=Dendryphion nanum TaxID=256645 RepID=A0A9P9DPZ8_9PLEO|nr:hypothetical protein B0J11DRAFT_341338 [Dendryphion nanum]
MSRGDTPSVPNNFYQHSEFQTSGDNKGRPNMFVDSAAKTRPDHKVRPTSSQEGNQMAADVAETYAITSLKSFDKLKIDPNDPLLYFPLPCMDCGLDDGHAPECHIGKIKPLGKIDAARVHWLADAVEHFDPEQWRCHDGPLPPPELEDPETVMREMVAIVRKGKSFKKDSIISAFRQCKDAEYVMQNGETRYILEAPSDDETEGEGTTDEGNENGSDEGNIEHLYNEMSDPRFAYFMRQQIRNIHPSTGVECELGEHDKGDS